MALYLFRFGYTAESWKALIENPQDRRDMLAARVLGMGGRLDGFWYSFGEHDGYALAELPDNVSAAAVSSAIAASGSCRELSTTVLLSAEEMLEALQRANRFAYSKPGA